MSLSHRAYLIVTLVVLLGIAGQWWGGALTHVWRYPTAAALLGLVYEGVRARTRRLAMQRRIEERAHLGRPIKGELVVRNNGHEQLRVQASMRYPSGFDGEHRVLEWDVQPGTEQGRVFQVTPTRLGRWDWQPVYARLLGRLGLAWWNRRLTLPGALEVLPDRLQDYERRVGTEQHGEVHKHRAGTGYELLGLRDYHPGDSMRAIDWKATARTGRHTVRVFTEEQHLELVVLMDIGRTSGLQAGSLTKLHHYVNVAARLAEKAVTNGDHVGMIVFADRPLHDFPPARGHAGLVQVRALLEHVRTLPRESNPLSAVLQVRKMVRHRSLVVMLTDVDDQYAAAQLIKAAHLLSPKHLPLVAGILDEDLLALRQSAATHWLDPYHAFAAMEATHAARRTVLRLRHMGCHVLQALPSGLDRAVLNHYATLRARKSI